MCSTWPSLHIFKTLPIVVPPGRKQTPSHVHTDVLAVLAWQNPPDSKANPEAPYSVLQYTVIILKSILTLHRRRSNDGTSACDTMIDGVPERAESEWADDDTDFTSLRPSHAAVVRYLHGLRRA